MGRAPEAYGEQVLLERGRGRSPIMKASFQRRNFPVFVAIQPPTEYASSQSAGQSLETGQGCLLLPFLGFISALVGFICLGGWKMAPRRRRGNVSPTLLAFGRQLRRYREEAGLTQESLGRRANNGRGVTSQYVGQVESGRTRCSREFAETMDRELKAGGRLLQLWDDLVLDAAFPVWFDWPVVEAEAVMLRSYQPIVIDGLLQTEAYARTLLFGDEDATAARLGRQKILHRSSPPPPTVVCLLDEAVLHNGLGGPEVMREQLEHLLEAISPRLTVQIVPRGIPHPGNTGAFAIATLDDRTEVAYADSALRGMTTSVGNEIQKVAESFEVIRSHALPVDQSVDFIKKVLEERWT